MSRLRFLLILSAMAGVAWFGLQLATWRAGKLATLQPLAMAGPSTAGLETLRANAATASATLLLFGDSRVRQWTPLPARPYAIAVEGFPGETAIQLAGRFPAILLAHGPSDVIVQAGVNDAVAASLVGRARREQALNDSLAAFDRIAADSKAAGARLVILKVLPPVRPDLVRRLVYRSAVDDYVASLNAALPGIAARHGATVADPLPLLTDDAGAVRATYRRDTLHFTPAAYAAMGDLLPPSLEVRG